MMLAIDRSSVIVHEKLCRVTSVDIGEIVGHRRLPVRSRRRQRRVGERLTWRCRVDVRRLLDRRCRRIGQFVVRMASRRCIAVAMNVGSCRCCRALIL